MKVEYKIYNPAGNITALVIGDKYSEEEKKKINDQIMQENKDVEQVGFLSIEEKRLTMAGGEFCGNATRCATLYYLDKANMQSELKINNQYIKTGIENDGNVWCEIPISNHKIENLDKDIYKVKLDGITIVTAKCVNQENDLKTKAKRIIEKYNLDDDAIGVMFEKEDELNNNKFILYPVVWVKSIDTLFLENACGSGTIGLSMVKSWQKNESGKYVVKQKSGEYLQTEIVIEKNRIIKAVLKGKINTDNVKRNIIIK